MADDNWNYIDKLCPVCGGRVRHYFDFDVCERCHYTLPDSNATQAVLYDIKSDGTSLAYGSISQSDLIPNMLKIDCEKIRLFQKGLDIEFDIDPKKLENIDVIEINGYRFIKEK